MLTPTRIALPPNAVPAPNFGRPGPTVVLIAAEQLPNTLSIPLLDRDLNIGSVSKVIVYSRSMAAAEEYQRLFDNLEFAGEFVYARTSKPLSTAPMLWIQQKICLLLAEDASLNEVVIVYDKRTIDDPDSLLRGLLIAAAAHGVRGRMIEAYPPRNLLDFGQTRHSN